MMRLLILVLTVAFAAGCSDAALVADTGPVLGELDGTIHGSLYDGGARDTEGADATTDEDVSGHDTGDADAWTAADAGGDGGRDAGPLDAGPKQCPPDLFATSRPAGDVKPGTPVSGDVIADCDAARYSVILAKGVKLHLSLTGEHLVAGLHVYGPGRRGLQTELLGTTAGMEIYTDFTADLPGEYFVVVDQAGRHGTSPFTLTVTCLEGCDLHATRYPIVMVHGFSGFQNIGPIDYFYRVADTFAPLGYDLHIAVLDAYNSTEVRGPQLAAYVDQVLADTFAEKVNFVAHSQGGIDARFIISGMSYGDRTGMLNMIATPHHGTQLCDAILNDPTGIGKPILDAMLSLMGVVLDGPQAQQDAHASFVTLSTAYMADFNTTHPDDPRVVYKSWAGRTCYVWESLCPNPVNTYLAATYQFLKDNAGENDGIVPTDSARWTGFQSVLDADHFDEVGQLLGATGGFDHIAFYRSVIEGIEADGY